MKLIVLIATAAMFATTAFAAHHEEDMTYAEKLGWAKGDRVLILHIDDAGMSWDSNQGTIRAIEEGVANSFSVMMPCPWVPDIVNYIKENPEVDAGLHLTLTSEWDVYRWPPLTGKPASPGLVDKEGAMWRSVQQVAVNASGDEVEAEIRAQLDRARTMGFEPTHLDSHMGTVFATADFIQRYVKVGIEEGIPVMFPGGHGHYAFAQYPGQAPMARSMGRMVWEGGLPVLDDLHNTSYDWGYDSNATDAQEIEGDPNYKIEEYVEAVRGLQPGVTMMIMHCTDPTEVFPKISNSGASRRGDLEAMLDPKLREVLEEEGIILTTWRELKERRDKAE